MRRPYIRRARLAQILGAIAAAGLLSISFTAEAAEELRLSRYTSVPQRPEAAQVDPLEASVQVYLPRELVHTVGDGVAYLLLRTGYRLPAREHLDAAAAAVMALPLPEVHRHLGPYSVKAALQVLLGEPFTLVVDPAQRTVAYRAAPATRTQDDAAVPTAMAASGSEQ